MVRMENNSRSVASRVIMGSPVLVRVTELVTFGKKREKNVLDAALKISVHVV